MHRRLVLKETLFVGGETEAVIVFSCHQSAVFKYNFQPINFYFTIFHFIKSTSKWVEMYFLHLLEKCDELFQWKEWKSYNMYGIECEIIEELNERVHAIDRGGPMCRFQLIYECDEFRSDICCTWMDTAERIRILLYRTVTVVINWGQSWKLSWELGKSLKKKVSKMFGFSTTLMFCFTRARGNAYLSLIKSWWQRCRSNSFGCVKSMENIVAHI